MVKDKLENKRIAIIGVGNMGGAIAGSLLKEGLVNSHNLVLTNKSLGKIVKFRKAGAIVLKDNNWAVKNSDIVIFAVKPHTLPEILSDIKKDISSGQLIVSIAAGISIKTFKKYLGYGQPIVRVMPNLAAQVSQSMSLWSASREVTRVQRNHVRKILKSWGEELYLASEDILDRLTTISGCGPAYIFYLCELMEKAGINFGLKKKQATLLAYQTLLGSARILEKTHEAPEILRKRVTSKKGVTAAVFHSLDKSEFGEAFFKALRAGYKRTKELRSLH